MGVIESTALAVTPIFVKINTVVPRVGENAVKNYLNTLLFRRFNKIFKVFFIP